jgi:hypothetical protein
MLSKKLAWLRGARHLVRLSLGHKRSHVFDAGGHSPNFFLKVSTLARRRSSLLRRSRWPCIFDPLRQHHLITGGIKKTLKGALGPRRIGMTLCECLLLRLELTWGTSNNVEPPPWMINGSLRPARFPVSSYIRPPQ